MYVPWMTPTLPGSSKRASAGKLGLGVAGMEGRREISEAAAASKLLYLLLATLGPPHSIESTALDLLIKTPSKTGCKSMQSICFLLLVWRLRSKEVRIRNSISAAPLMCQAPFHVLHTDNSFKLHNNPCEVLSCVYVMCISRADLRTDLLSHLFKLVWLMSGSTIGFEPRTSPTAHTFH